jgi:hypothetical protein
MRAALLHLDDALGPQTALGARVMGDGGVALDCRELGPALRLWSRPAALERLRQRLGEGLGACEGRRLVFAGSGDFHHVTPLLLRRACEAAGEPPVTVIHFDNHPDWVKFDNGMHCGSWVARAARLPGVAKVITVGVCSPDIDRPRSKGADLSLVVDDKVELYPYLAPHGAPSLDLCGREWPSIESMGEAAFAEFLPGRIPTEAVYVTIDKDVLRPEDASTNWDQGRTSEAFLAQLIGRVLAGHELIGADVVGDWSPARYGGGMLAAVLKQGEALLDQPWRSPPAGAARALNEAVNLRLYDLFAGAAA